jgi:hypothetical protein
MTNEPQPAASEQVRDRVQWPALFLIATAAINLLIALFQTGRVVSTAIAPAAEGYQAEREMWERLAERTTSRLIAGRVESLRQTSPEDLKRQNVFTEGIIAVALLVPAVLALAGGVRMYQLRSYPLAVVGSLASAIPIMSPLTCCCVGEVVGIWCVMILLQPPVREAFR